MILLTNVNSVISSILNLVADVRLSIFLSSIDTFVEHQNSKESKYDSEECAPAGSSEYDR